jgi:hypothetical protein
MQIFRLASFVTFENTLTKGHSTSSLWRVADPVATKKKKEAESDQRWRKEGKR